MDTDHPTSRYTRAEEIVNSLTHGIGAVLAIAGLAVLTAFAAVYGDGWHIVSSAVFGAALILLYLSSTLYHAVHHPRAVVGEHDAVHARVCHGLRIVDRLHALDHELARPHAPDHI